MFTNDKTLASALDKLARRQRFSADEADAFLGLQHRLVRLDAAKFIVREGDRADQCAALLSGYVYRHKITGDGSRQILAIHLRGDLVDLQNSLLDRADHSVQALTAVDVAFIPRTAIIDLVARCPNVTRAMWLDTLVDASIGREWMLNVGQRDARTRIAHLLCELALRQEAAGLCQGPRYDLPMTQEQIGDVTGLTAVHVNRTMQTLRADGMIGTNGRTVTVLDWRRLQTAGDFNRAYLHESLAETAEQDRSRALA